MAGGVLVGQGRAGGHRGTRVPCGALAEGAALSSRPSAALCLRGAVPAERRGRPGAVPTRGVRFSALRGARGAFRVLLLARPRTFGL